jgi:hypothetical protein
MSKLYSNGYQLISLVILSLLLVLVGCKKNETDEIPLSDIPTITSVSPNEGTVGTEITIIGTNFKSAAQVMVGGIATAEVDVFSSTTIYAKVPAGISPNVLLAVKVRNPLGGEATLPNSFIAINPVIQYVNSATKPSGNIGSTVILEGKAFGDNKGESKVKFSDGTGGFIEATIASEEDWTDSFIVTTVPNGTADGPVVVETAIGNSNEIAFKVTAAATFSPSTINWSLTTPLPAGVSGHKAISVPVDDVLGVTNNYIYVIGGSNTSNQSVNQTYFSIVNNEASINEWTSASELPDGLSFHSVVAATPFNSKVLGSGFLYSLGGKNTSGESVSTIYIAALNTDGTIQQWSTTRSLPQALHGLGAVIFRSTIYIAGGALNDNTPVLTAYKSKINENGELDEWELLPNLPNALAYHGFHSFGGYLYCVGGETGVTTPENGGQVTPTADVCYSRINLRTGEIAEWTINPSNIGKERSKHLSLVLGGNMFISSGLYAGLSPNTGGSSENAYANINSDGTIGSFNGATGSNTLYSTGGNNLFNLSGVSYIDSEGVAHVMVIGGAKVGSPNTKIDKVLYY